jgi:hypothetical protein
LLLSIKNVYCMAFYGLRYAPRDVRSAVVSFAEGIVWQLKCGRQQSPPSACVKAFFKVPPTFFMTSSFVLSRFCFLLINDAFKASSSSLISFMFCFLNSVSVRFFVFKHNKKRWSFIGRNRINKFSCISSI